MSKLPNCFLVGAPKAGTTSLYHDLDQHPQISMSPLKEPHYFAEEIPFENFTVDYRDDVLKLANLLNCWLGQRDVP